jgi:hypothetical protein
LPMVLQMKFARQKKRFPAWNIPTDFYSVGDIGIYRQLRTVGKAVGECLNIDRIYPSVNSSVSVATTVKCRRIKSVSECLKYRPDISVCKYVGKCYCQMPTDSFRQ